MQQPSEVPSHHEPAPILGYAEPSTTPRLSLVQWLRRKWFFICIKGGLVFAMIAIGATLASNYMDWKPAFPWQASLEIRNTLQGQTPTNENVVSQDRDAVSATGWAQNLNETDQWLSEYALTATAIRDRVKISQIRSDGSFTITFVGENQGICHTLMQGYGDGLQSLINSTSQKVEVRYHYPKMSDLASNAPLINMLVGAGCGLLIATAVL